MATTEKEDNTQRYTDSIAHETIEAPNGNRYRHRRDYEDADGATRCVLSGLTHSHRMYIRKRKLRRLLDGAWTIVEDDE